MTAKMAAFLPVFLVLLAYAQCVNYPFVYDDLSGILDNPGIARAGTVEGASRTLLESWRPLTRFSYALTHVLWGFDRRIFHMTNIAIHALATLLVFGIAIRLATRWLPGANPAHFAFAA